MILVCLCSFTSCKPEHSNNYFLKVIPTVSQTLPTDSLVNPEGTTVKTRFKVPDNFYRINPNEQSFGFYLQNFPLKPHQSNVFFYNGQLKNRQDVHEAVLDISIGTKDLQQCADAVMRLRAEFLYEQKKFDQIHFNFSNGFVASYRKWRYGNRIQVNGNTVIWVPTQKTSTTYLSFQEYLTWVYMYAGTLSLSKELPKANLENIQIGDIFIKGGSPGHAVIVVDMAQNEQGEKLIMLAQSYMPAQNIHILKNPNDTNLSPWYSLKNLETLITPEWTFTKSQLKTWN